MKNKFEKDESLEYKARLAREKYRTDPESRKMHIEASGRWQKRNRKKVTEQERKRYAERTQQQINKRKRYLKKLRSRK